MRGIINIVKMSKLLIMIYGFKAIPEEIPINVFTELEKSHPEIATEARKTSNS